MKKILALMLTLVMVFSLTACGGAASSATAPESNAAAPAADGAKPVSTEQPIAGVCWYNFADTFIANARTTLNKVAADGGRVKIIDADSQNDIAMQTNNINNFYTQDINYMIINNINVNAKPEMIEQAKAKGIPLIFANTDSPTEEEFAMYDKVYHVSSAAEQSGTIIGEQIVKYWKENPSADRNGNGKLDYVMLLGVQQHYDTQVRAKFSVEAIQAAGIEVNLVQESICNYQRSDAQNQMASILQARKGDVEAVIACNDDMALGAIEALKAANFFKDKASFIPVVGVDATVVGVEALQEGMLLGTALNNPVILGNAIYNLIELLEDGKELTQESIGMEGVRVEGHHIYIDYIGITADNVADATY